MSITGEGWGAGSSLNIPSVDGLFSHDALPAVNIPSFDGFFGPDPLPAANIPSVDGFPVDRGFRR
jgi:hypothetical protein